MATPFLNGIDVNNQRVLAVADPSSGTDGANKQYVDAKVSGLSWKDEVVAATTANGALATAFEDSDTLDGVTLATGDRILLKDQTDPTENGVYVVAVSGAPTRAADADSATDLNNATVFVLGGTVNEGRAYTQITKNPAVGSDDIVFAIFGGGTTYSADGQGIELSGTQFQLELDGTTLTKSGSGLRIGSGAAGSGITEASGVLAVNTGTGLEVSSDAVRIAAAAAGDGLTGGAGSALAVNVGDGLEIAADAVAVDLAVNSGLTFSSGDLAIDTSVVARKYAANIGDGSTTAIAVTHNLGTKDVHVTVRRNSDDAIVYADVVATSTTVVTITFNAAPASNAYRAVVVG